MSSLLSYSDQKSIQEIAVIFCQNFRSNVSFLIKCMYNLNHECTYCSCHPNLASSITLSNYKKDLLLFTLTVQCIRCHTNIPYSSDSKRRTWTEKTASNFFNITIVTKNIFSCKDISDRQKTSIFFTRMVKSVPVLGLSSWIRQCKETSQSLIQRTSMSTFQINSVKTNEPKILKFIHTMVFPDK